MGCQPRAGRSNRDTTNRERRADGELVAEHHVCHERYRRQQNRRERPDEVEHKRVQPRCQKCQRRVFPKG